MDSSSICAQCGKSVDKGQAFCSNCGLAVATVTATNHGKKTKQKTEAKSAKTALILCLLFGTFGLHRFYVGKWGTGLLMIMTIGGFGLWLLIDLILIVLNKFEDKEGKTLLFSDQPSNLRKALLVIGAIFAFFLMYAAAIIGAVFYLTAGLVSIVNEQLLALRDGNIPEAYSYMSQSYRDRFSLEQFSQAINANPALKTTQSSFFNMREINTSGGMLQGTLTDTNGAKTPARFLLIREGDSWKILSFSLNPSDAIEGFKVQ